MGRILLGADTESLVRPALLGLEDVNIDAEDWLVAASDATGVREQAATDGLIDEAWIVSSDDVPGINLAAALRADNAALPVYLVMSEPSGSDVSRANQARITGMLTASAFRDRFSSERRRRRPVERSAQPMDAPSAGRAPEKVSKKTPGKVGKAASEQVECASRLEPLKLVPPIVPKKETSAFVLSVMSGSGGVGKSAFTAVGAFRCCRRGFKTAVIDCDLQFGDLRHMMGAVEALCIDEVLEDPSQVAALAGRARPGEPVLAYAPRRLERSEELGPHLAELVELFAAAFEMILVNTGSSWTESHAQLLERSNCAVFLLDQRASSVRSCQHALDLCLRLGIATGSFAYALNRCERGALFSAVDIANVMHGTQVFELKEGGSEVEELLGAGLAGELAASRNDFCSSVDAMLGEVLP